MAFKTGVSFGSDLTLQSLSEDGFSAVFIGIGAHGSLKMRIPGEEGTSGVIDAIGFLKDANLGKKAKPYKDHDARR